MKAKSTPTDQDAIEYLDKKQKMIKKLEKKNQ